MPTRLCINNELCHNLTQLQEHLKGITYDSNVFSDILEYALCGDLSTWLCEHGHEDIADKVSSIDNTISDTDFVNQLTNLLLDNPSIIKKPNYINCFSCDVSIPNKNSKEISVQLSIMPKSLINENFEIKVSCGWGTKIHMYNPSKYEVCTIKKEIIAFHRHNNTSVGNIVVSIDGKQVFACDTNTDNTKFCPNCGIALTNQNPSKEKGGKAIAPLDTYLNEVYREQSDSLIREYINGLLLKGMISISTNDDGFQIIGLLFPLAEFDAFVQGCIEEARDNHEIIDGQIIESSNFRNKLKIYIDEEKGFNLSNLFHDFAIANKTYNAAIIPEWKISIISKVFYRKGFDVFVDGFDEKVGIGDKDNYSLNLGALAIRKSFKIGSSLNGFLGNICTISDDKGMVGICYRGNPLLPNEMTLICPPIFKEVSQSKDNMVRIKDESGMYGYIDLEGNYFIKPQFENAEFFHCGRALVRDKGNGKYGYIDKSGNLVIPFKYIWARTFKDNLAFVVFEDANGKRTEMKIDVNGNEQIYQSSNCH